MTEKNALAVEAYLTPRQLADQLQVDRQWVYRQVRLRLIPFYKVGAHVRFDRVKVSAWLTEHECVGDGPRPVRRSA